MAVGVCVADGVSVAVCEAVAVAVGEVEVAVGVAVAVNVEVAVAVVVGDCEGVAVAVAVGGCELRRVMRGATQRAKSSCELPFVNTVRMNLTLCPLNALRSTLIV